MQLHLTDQQFIERVRWNHRHRWKFGLVFAIFGLAGIVWILYVVTNMYQNSKAALDLNAHSPNPSSRQVAISVDETRYVIGFTRGLIYAYFLAGMGILAAAGFVLLLTKGRKDTLLLKCWDAGAPTQ